MNNPLKLIDPLGLWYINPLEGLDPWQIERSVQPCICSGSEGKNASTVAVDAGHGAPQAPGEQPDPGATAGGILEKNLALAIANAVTAELRAMGINAIQTRTGDISKFQGTPNGWRLDLAKAAGATIFVSIHINCCNGSGIEILHNSAGMDLAEEILRANTVFGLRDNPIIDASGRDFTVLDFFKGPSVIIEAGFISSSSDRGKIQSETVKIGKEIATGIKNFIEKQ